MRETSQDGLIERRLSPVALRRWRSFKSNRRGFVSGWIFLVLTTAGLFLAGADALIGQWSEPSL